MGALAADGGTLDAEGGAGEASMPAPEGGGGSIETGGGSSDGPGNTCSPRETGEGVGVRELPSQAASSAATRASALW